MAEMVKREGNKVEFKVVVPAAEVNKSHNQVWADLAKDVRIPGFRAGKVPRKVIEGRLGKANIEDRVINAILNTHAVSGANSLGLNLVEIDAIDNLPALELGKSFEFTVKGEVYPKVQLGQWKTLDLNSNKTEITDEIMERVLSDLQERNATFEVAERPAESGDRVLIEEDGSESYSIYLPDAEEAVRNAIVGKSANESFDVTLPVTGEGEAQVISAKVVTVRSKKVPELNDEFAKSLNLDSLDALRSTLKSELEERADAESSNAMREDFINQLVEGMSVDIPNALITGRLNHILRDVKNDIKRQGVLWDEYQDLLKSQGKLDDFTNNLKANAESSLRRELALNQLSVDLKVHIGSPEFNQALINFAQSSGSTLQTMVNQLGSDGINNLYQELIREKALMLALSKINSPEQEEALPEKTEEAPEAPEESTSDS